MAIHKVLGRVRICCRNRKGSALTARPVLARGVVSGSATPGASLGRSQEPFLKTLRIGRRPQARATEQITQGHQSACTVLIASNLAVAIDHHILRKSLGSKRLLQIRFPRQHNMTLSRTLFQIPFYLQPRLTNVHRKHDKALFGELRGHLIDGGLVAAAVSAPCRPELNQHHFALHRIIIESAAIKSLGAKLRRGLAAIERRSTGDSKRQCAEK